MPIIRLSKLNYSVIRQPGTANSVAQTKLSTAEKFCTGNYDIQLAHISKSNLAKRRFKDERARFRVTVFDRPSVSFYSPPADNYLSSSGPVKNDGDLWFVIPKNRTHRYESLSSSRWNGPLTVRWTTFDPVMSSTEAVNWCGER